VSIYNQLAIEFNKGIYSSKKKPSEGTTQNPSEFLVLTAKSNENYTQEFNELKGMDISIKKFFELKNLLWDKYAATAKTFGQDENNELMRIIKTTLKL